MPRTLKEQRLQDRAARARLPRRHHPYWRSISQGQHLGYYKGARSGSWIARCLCPRDRVYLTRRLGASDDDPVRASTALSWAEALEEAQAWFRQVNGAVEPHNYTVGQALDDYLAAFAGKSLAKTRHTIDRNIRPVLGERLVADLTTAELRQFQAELSTRPSFYRANRLGIAKERPDDGDSVRRGKANANRIFTPLRAALNRAFQDGKVADDAAWRRVKPFPKVSVARVRYFTPPEVEALLSAAEPWFRPLIQAALFTGGRWSEIHKMKVRDVDLANGTVLFPETKSGRPRHVYLTDDGMRFFGGQCGRKNSPSRWLFVNQHGRPFGPSHQIRPMAETCRKAGIDPAGFHILRHTYGSTLAMAGVPLPVIAESLGHADERITRKHYAHLSPSYVRDAIRAGLGSLGAYRTALKAV